MKKKEDEKKDLNFFYLNKTRFLIPFVKLGLAPLIDFIIYPSFLLKNSQLE